jgi:hypothetical protein
MTIEASVPIVSTPADEPAATKEESTQLQSGSEAQFEVQAAVGDGAPSCETLQEKEDVTGDASLKDEEEPAKVDSIVSDEVKGEPALVDSDGKQQGIKPESICFTFFDQHDLIVICFVSRSGRRGT